MWRGSLPGWARDGPDRPSGQTWGERRPPAGAPVLDWGCPHRGRVGARPQKAGPLRTKAPRRTAQRILQVTLDLFNRFGVPHVSTTLIANELGISAGNLYYHFPAKDTLINALFDRYEQALDEVLLAAPEVRHVEDAWLFFHLLFEHLYAHRFLYRDLNDLLSTNRRLETHVQGVLSRKLLAVQALLLGLETGGQLDDPGPGRPVMDRLALATQMVVLLTYWLSYEYARQPRTALEPGHAPQALARGAWHVLSLLLPHLGTGARSHLETLAAPYRETA